MSKKQEETKRKHTTARLPQKQMLWGIAGVSVLALLFFVSTLFAKKSVLPLSVVDEPTSQTPSYTARHPLSGACLEHSVDLPRVFSVMVDNHEDARPQSGIDQAFLVIEAPVEAGIPRLMAFFDASQNVEKIGPVRSARPYFVDWANEFDALYTHVGGSNESLEKISSGGTFDLNEFSHGSSFWRAKTRLAPHNAYTSSELLNEYLVTRSDAGVAPEVLYETWKFKDPAEQIDEQLRSTVNIDFWAPTYSVDWSFDPKTDRYLRSQDGTTDQTLEGVSVVADNVVIVVTDISVLDTVGHRKVRTTGSGKGWVMQDGKILDVLWEKPSTSQRLKFFATDAESKDPKEIEMNPGMTWIEVVPSVYDVTFGQE